MRRLDICGPAGVREIDEMLDTVAAYTVIAWDAANGIGREAGVSERRMPIVTTNGVVEAPLISVESIQLENPEAEAVDVICHDIPRIAETERLVGISFLQHFRTLIDHLSGVLETTV